MTAFFLLLGASPLLVACIALLFANLGLEVLRWRQARRLERRLAALDLGAHVVHDQIEQATSSYRIGATRKDTSHDLEEQVQWLVALANRLEKERDAARDALGDGMSGVG